MSGSHTGSVTVPVAAIPTQNARSPCIVRLRSYSRASCVLRRRSTALQCAWCSSTSRRNIVIRACSEPSSNVWTSGYVTSRGCARDTRDNACCTLHSVGRTHSSHGGTHVDRPIPVLVEVSQLLPRAKTTGRLVSPSESHKGWRFILARSQLAPSLN